MERLGRSAAGRFYAKLTADRATRLAVLIAWQGLLSLFPLILGLLGVFGMLLTDPDQYQALATRMAASFPEQFDELLGFIEHTREASTRLYVASLVGLAMSGYWLFGTMEFVFNRIYGVADRGYLGQARMALAMTAIYAVLTTVSVLTSEVPQVLALLAERLAIEVSWTVLMTGNLVSLASAVLMFLALYTVVPNRPLTPSNVWPGALLAGVLFVLLHQVFPLYMWLFGNSYAVYQALGLFLLLMAWFYFLAVILVVGAELNAFLMGPGERRPPTTEAGADDHRIE